MLYIYQLVNDFKKKIHVIRTAHNQGEDTFNPSIRGICNAGIAGIKMALNWLFQFDNHCILPINYEKLGEYILEALKSAPEGHIFWSNFQNILTGSMNKNVLVIIQRRKKSENTG